MASASDLTPAQRIELINDNLQEVLNPEIIEDVVVKQNRPLVLYWGTATTGRPHCGYFVPLLKIAQFLAAGCKVKILLADIHAFLDNLKAPIELVNKRAEYYKRIICAALTSIGVSIDQLEFVLGSTYQLTPRYTMDLFRLSSITTEHDAKKAGSEVVKQVSNAPLSGLIYPLMQALDEEFLEVDAQFGGVDQRKIFALAKDALPKIGYKERAHLMNPMVPGLNGGKMSASDKDSKIDLLDTEKEVRSKLRKSVCAPAVTEGNGIIAFAEYVLFPASALKSANGRDPRFVVPRRAEEGGDLVYTSAADMKRDFEADVLTPQLLKGAVTDVLVEMMKPIWAMFEADEEWQRIEKEAYPAPVEVKKVKKVKNKGTRHPGAVATAASEAAGTLAEAATGVSDAAAAVAHAVVGGAGDQGAKGSTEGGEPAKQGPSAAAEKFVAATAMLTVDEPIEAANTM